MNCEWPQNKRNLLKKIAQEKDERKKEIQLKKQIHLYGGAINPTLNLVYGVHLATPDVWVTTLSIAAYAT